jgi:autotransporter-associated beta strand protein
MNLPARLSLVLLLAALPTQLTAQLPAFPGAEGFGRFATGGRSGTVYHVTTTNDSGAGSFRDAVSVANRTIVFDIGGVIDYKTPRYAPKANITIAGQTAPGDGVTIYGNGLSFSGSHNAIVRFVRVREGVNGDSGTDCIGIANGHDMIFDHLSVSWGRDETFSVNASGAATNITIQSCIIAQGLQTHSAGGLIQTDGGVSILRSLYIDNDTRNPKVKFKNEFVNNVVANWETIGYNMGGDSAGDSYANAFNNYFIKGPNSSSSAFGGGNANFHIYATNNWVDANRNGILDGGEWPIASYGDMDLQTTPFAYPITNAYPPLTALKLAISDVGASQRRDVVDERLITEVLSGGVLGETISSEFAAPMSGPGVIRNGPTPLDTDQDGMPDYWELGTGSAPYTANNNAASPSGSGYTRLEDYLNWLAEPHAVVLTNTACDIELIQFTRGFTNYSPAFTVANATNGTVTLSAGGRRAHFQPSTDYSGPAAFTFLVTDSDGSTLKRQVNLFFTPMVTNTCFVWRGDALTNTWDVLGGLNWFDGVSALVQFHNGDTVSFDDTGFNSPTLSLTGALAPASVSVNSSRDYTLGGAGSLGGSMSLTKAGSGAFRLNTTNTFTGNSTVTNGTLLVNGALTQSPVTVLSGGSAGGAGFLGAGLTVLSGGSAVAGDGIGSPGTLTITNALTETGGAINRFDLTDDPTGLLKTNDQIRIQGNLNLSGANTVVVNLLNGPLANGDYVLITYTGTFNGGLTNLVVSGANGTLATAPGQILLHVDNTRAPAALVWRGGYSANTWDTGTNANWMNGSSQDRFYFGDAVLFDDTGSTNPSVNLVGTLTPASITVNSTNSFTLAGTGKISGTGPLVKTNSGTLSITTTNDFTGPVILGGGVLAVSRLANGAAVSGLGASSNDPTNLVFCGGALRYTGSSVAIDRRATFSSNGIIDVASGTLTANGPFTGSGALIKAGAGTLAIPTNNAHTGGVVISNGAITLTSTAGRDSGLGTGTTTLSGGTLQLYGYSGSTGTDYGAFNRPLAVIAGTTNALLTPPRYTMSSTLSGSGTLNLTVDYVRGTLSANWSGFNGTLNVTGRVASSEFRVANTAGYGGASVFITDNVVITRSGSAATIDFGSLGGTSGSVVGPGSSTSSGSSYRVGLNHTDATFAGTLKADGVNAFTKAGTGRWTLTGANTYSGGTTINGGILQANNTSGSATGTGAITVNSGGALGGTGSVSGAVTVNAGGAISPGSNGVGTVTLTGGLTLNSGALLNIDLGATNDKVAVTGALALNGTINLTNLSGFAAGTYPIITYTGALSGSLPAIGSRPSGYVASVNTNTAGQVRLIVQKLSTPGVAQAALSNGQLVLSGTNGTASLNYRVLTSTNLSAPLSQWTVVSTNQFDAAGAFVCTNAISTGEARRFYRLVSP